MNISKTQNFIEPFSKSCDIRCHKGYTGKNEKQVEFYVNLDGAETFSDIMIINILCQTFL